MRKRFRFGCGLPATPARLHAVGPLEFALVTVVMLAYKPAGIGRRPREGIEQDMTTLPPGHPTGVALVTAIHSGDVRSLRRILATEPSLATVRLRGGRRRRDMRTLLHVATDWPGHFPRVAETIAVLIEAGADPNARFIGRHRETPLHWAASSDDIEALDTLLDMGADINADGAVIADGSPLRDATAFAQWEAARRLVARGCEVALFDAASLGLMPVVEKYLAADSSVATLSDALWAACHGGQLTVARSLADLGADLDRQPVWSQLTPLDAATRAGADQVVAWLRERGATSSSQLDEG